MKIFGCILVLILALMLVPVVIHFDSAPQLTVTVNYFWIKKKIFPQKEKRIQKPKSARDKAAGKKKQAKKKPKLPDTPQELFSTLIKFVKRTGPTVRRMLRRTSLAKFRLRMIVADSDAAKTAMKFGRVNAEVFYIVALIERVVTLKTDQIDILPGFGAEKSEMSYSGEIRLSPLFLLVAGVQLIFWGLPLMLKFRKPKASQKIDGVVAEQRKEDNDGKKTPA